MSVCWLINDLIAQRKIPPNSSSLIFGSMTLDLMILGPFFGNNTVFGPGFVYGTGNDLKERC